MCMLYFIDWSSLKQKEGFFVFFNFFAYIERFLYSLCIQFYASS